MSNKTVKTFGGWMDSVNTHQKAAAMAKQASEADPTNKGTAPTPTNQVNQNRSKLDLPKATPTNADGTSNDLHIHSETQPNGVGQGSYITPRDGKVTEDAFTSPTTPLSKISSALRDAAQNLGLNTPDTVQAEKPASAVSAPATISLPDYLLGDATIMDKLASIGLATVSTVEGQNLVINILEHESGVKEASAIINSVCGQVEKQASVAAEQESAYMQKQASDQNDHGVWLNHLSSDLEKLAYVQGAEDAEAMNQAVEAGGEATIPGAEDAISDEDIMQAIAELVQSGQMSEEEAEQVLQALSGDGAVGGELEQLAAELQEAVQSGAISPESAEALAQSIMQDMQGGQEAPMEGAPMEGAPVEKAASIMQSLFQ